MLYDIMHATRFNTGTIGHYIDSTIMYMIESNKISPKIIRKSPLISILFVATMNEYLDHFRYIRCFWVKGTYTDWGCCAKRSLRPYFSPTYINDDYYFGSIVLIIKYFVFYSTISLNIIPWLWVRAVDWGC